MTSDIIVELDNDTIIVATAKVHRQQAIASSFDNDTRIPKSARDAFKLNASETITGTTKF
jgi:anionic cell wall polymer biosynthesis LytR-Cps2A-Psr (LCP) family protein